MIALLGTIALIAGVLLTWFLIMTRLTPERYDVDVDEV